MLYRIILSSLLIFFSSYAGDYIKLKKPPKSLDKYFPPNSEQPVFLYNMYDASTSFTGMFANIQQEDWENALKWAKNLEKVYLKIGEMVPEWKKLLRKNEIKALVEAVKNKNLSKVRMYANKVGQSCSNCHKKYMLSVKVKYHYPSYKLISIEDPVSGNEYEIDNYMKKLSNDYKLVKVFTKDGKFNHALKFADSFSKRYKALTQMCTECHTNNIVEEVYFGKDTEKVLNSLIKFVQAKDSKNVMKAMGEIGGNCYKCHNIHEVPYMLKEKFSK